MNTTSKAQFARDCGVSKPAISKAVNEGRVIVDDKGKVNLDDPHTRSFIQTQRDKKKPPPRKPPEEKKKKPATIKPAKNKLTEEEKGEAKDSGGQLEMTFLSLDEITPENIRYLTKNQIDILDKYEAALARKQKRESERNMLISRSYIESVFSKLYSVDTNELKEMEDRLTPVICGVFKHEEGCDEAIKIRKLLNDEITRSLRHIKRIMDESLSKTEVKK